MFYIIKVIRGNEEFSDKLVAKDVNTKSISEMVINLTSKFKNKNGETVIEMGY